MGKTSTTMAVNEFFILGPTLAEGNKVLEAIHSLYYLPDNFKLVFTGAAPVDPAFYGKVVRLVERDKLGSRVHFTNNARNSDVVISDKTSSDPKNGVSGDSAEAIASAILDAARTTV